MVLMRMPTGDFFVRTHDQAAALFLACPPTGCAVSTQ
jgi:hypothetical protein